MTPEIEAIKHIGHIENGELVCNKDCPSTAHMNTKDSEWETEFDKCWNDKERDGFFDRRTTKREIKSFIRTLLSSKDVRIKELEDELEDLRLEAKNEYD